MRISDWSSDVCSSDLQFRGEPRSAAASPCGAFPPPLQGEGRGGDGVPQRRRDVTCSERKPIPTKTLPLKGRASQLGISASAPAAPRDQAHRILPHCPPHLLTFPLPGHPPPTPHGSA